MAVPTTWQWFPVSAGDRNIDVYEFYRQCYRALDWRVRVRHNDASIHFYRTNFPWGNGTITSITYNSSDKTYSIVDTNANYEQWVTPLANPSDATQKRWTGFTNTNLKWFPSAYDIIIECGTQPHDEEMKVIRGKIIDSSCVSNGTTPATYSGTVKVAAYDLDQFATEDAIGGVTSVIPGKPYQIIKRDGLSWADRLPEWPSPNYVNGIIQGVTADFDAGTTTVYLNKRTGLDDSYADCDAMTYAAGKLYRISSIVHNQGLSVSFDSISSGDTTVSGSSVSASTTYNGWLVYFEVTHGTDPTPIASGLATIGSGSFSVGGSGAYNGFNVAYAVTPDIGSVFAIVDSGAIWRDKKSAYFKRFYTGASVNYWTRSPASIPNEVSLQTTAFAATNVVWQEDTGDMGSCEDNNHGAMDQDVWSEIVMGSGFPETGPPCSTPDNCYSPQFYKCWRALQVSTEGESGGWIEKKSYGGVKNIHALTLAEFFKVIAVNYGTSTVAGSGTSNRHFSGSSTYNGWQVVWSVISSDNEVKLTGSGFLISGSVDMGTTSSIYDGLSVVYSAGWLRCWPRRFTRMYPCTVFVPDTDGMGDVIDPPKDDPQDPPPADPNPNHDATGEWLSKLPDTNYLEYDDQGFPQTGVADVAGELARYMGTPPNDPCVLDDVRGGTGRPDGYAPDTPYELRLSVYRRSGDALTVTSSTSTSVTDSSKKWWSRELSIGDSHVTGTPTSISTTTIRDTSKSADNFWIHPERGYWQFHIVEILQPGAYDEDTPTGPGTDGDLHKTKRVITAYNGTTQSMTFDAVSGLASTYTYTDDEGDEQTGTTTYRLHVPAYELHRWRGRVLRIESGTDGILDLRIKYSDNDTVWFDNPGFEIPEGTIGQIIEYQPGGVWQFATGLPDNPETPYVQLNDAATQFWIQPTGSDSRTGRTFSRNQKAIAPTHVSGYGRQRKGDYVTAELLNSVYRGIKYLSWTTVNVGWTSKGELNSAAGFFGGWDKTHVEHVYDNADDDGDGVGDYFGPSDAGGAAPSATTSGRKPYHNPGSGISAEHPGASGMARIYSYGTVTVPCTIVNSSVDFYDYAVKPTAGVDPPNHSDFDANGDSVTENNWSVWTTFGYTAGSSATLITSSPLGSLAHPDWCDEPPDQSPSTRPYGPAPGARAKGYIVTDQRGVIKFDVSGGMPFQ